MYRYIGFTKNARFIFQDFTTGDVLIKQNEADDFGISYPYEQWVSEKEKIADLETIKQEFNPLRPEPTVEEIEDAARERAVRMKAATVVLAQVLAKTISNIINQKR